MRPMILLALAFSLSACAGLNNLTPEQRQAFFAQQREMQQRNYEAQMASINAWGQANAARAAGQTNCTTTVNGNQAYTHCQ